jgi:hypothetical protein
MDRIDLGRMLFVFAKTITEGKLYATSLDKPIRILKYSTR